MARYYVYVNATNNDGGGGRYRNRYYNGDLQNARGILLTDTEKPLSAEMQREVASSEHFKKLFGEVYFVFPREEGTVISNDTNFLTCLPDKAGKKDLVHIFGRNEISTLNLYDRYNNCFELVKQVMGCDACPKKGIPCLAQELKLPAPILKHVTSDNVGATRKKIEGILEYKQHVSIGDFEYISPHLTTDEDFSDPVRGVAAHDFSLIQGRRAEKSERSKEGAETRAFKKEVCIKCPLDEVCTAAASCVGPYPLDPHQTNEVLPKWLKRYQDKTKNPFEPWQFWSLAHKCLFEHPKWKPDNVKGARPRRILFEGLVWNENKGFQAVAEFCRIDTSLAFTTGDYAYLLRWFPDLPATAAEARKEKIDKPPKNKTVLAIWFETLNKSHRTRQASGWGWHVRRQINGRQLLTARYNDGKEAVHLGYAYNDKWNTAGGYGSNMSCWADFWSDFDKLPLGQTTVRPTFRQRRDARKLGGIINPSEDQTEDSSS